MMSRTLHASAGLFAAVAVMAVPACHRQLSVKGAGGDSGEIDGGETGPTASGGTSGGVLGGIDQGSAAGSGGDTATGSGGGGDATASGGAGNIAPTVSTGGAPASSGGGPGHGPGAMNGGGGRTGSGGAPGSTGGVMSSGGAAGGGLASASGGASGAGGRPGSGGSSGSASAAAIKNVQMLATLTDIEPLAVGTNGVSLLQYAASGEAIVLYVDWSGTSTTWYRNSRASYAYPAASGVRQVDLLYVNAGYEIDEDGKAQDVSGTVTTYKEYLTANSQGFAWVNFETTGSPPMTSKLGSIVLQSWTGSRSSLTDASRYRSRPQMSESLIAYVEYASTAPGTVGQVRFQALGPGAVASPAAASAYHQDRPATDGDWVVWEEYPTSTDAVIRARNVTTGEVRTLSASVGFRTSPDIKGNLVVWQDERSGSGEIYMNDLGTTAGERVVVSGKGYSAAPRLTADGLVWIESYGGSTGLVKASWAY